MKLNTKIPDAVGFQLAPMLDVVFLLLIFFIVTQKFVLNEQDLNVQVPTSHTEEQENQERAIDEIIINVRADENDQLLITVDGMVLTPEALQARLIRMVATNAQQPVRIRGDAKMDWQKMADVINLCTEVGVYNVNFSTRVNKGGDKAAAPTAPTAPAAQPAA